MKRSLAVALSCAFLLGGVAAAALAEEAKAPSLYQRIGGFDKFAAVFDDLAPRMAADPKLQHFFVGHAADSHMRQRMLLLEMLCAETGGPCTYIGRPLKTAHTGLGIGSAEWDAFLGHLGAALDHQGIGKTEKDELVALVVRYKGDIVEKP